MRRALFFIAVLGVTYGVKRFYSEASAEELRFVLAPTTGLVEAVTGARFSFVPGAGYASAERAFVIAPVCAGLNFFLAAFLTGCVGFFRRLETGAGLSALFLGSAGVAAVATVVVNAVRISLALSTHTDATVHRALGIIVYSAALALLFHGARSLLREA